MPAVDQQRADQLLALARARFDTTLRPIEEQVLIHSCRYEDPPDWASSSMSGIEAAAANGGRSRPERTPTGRPLPGWQGPELRPALLRWALTDLEATALLEPRGLRVWNARLTEPLDLTGCHITARLELRYCLVEAPILLASAELPALSLRNSTLQLDLNAPSLKLRGSLCLEDITAADTLRFDSATIEGQVSLADCTFTTPNVALSMECATIQSNLILWPGFRSSGLVDLSRMGVGGYVHMSGAKLTADETALTLSNSTIRKSIYLNDGLESAGTIDLSGVEIGGALICRGARLTATGTALSLNTAKVRGGVNLREGFESAGEINMEGAEIDWLNSQGARLTANEVALCLENAKVRRNVFLSEGFFSSGALLMAGVEIGGQLICHGATLTASGDALSLDNATICGSVFLRDGFTAAGEIRMFHAEIGGTLEFDGAKLTATGDALRLDKVKIRGSVYFQNGFECAGEIGMFDASIGGSLECYGAKLTATGNALSLNNAKVGGDVKLGSGFESAGRINFFGTEIDGVLMCNAAKLTTTDTALSLHSAKVHRGVLLGGGFESAGQIDMFGALLGGMFGCRNVKLAPAGVALSLVNASLHGSMYLMEPFACGGEIRMFGVQIDGTLRCEGSKLTATGVALSLSNATIHEGVTLANGFESAGLIDLSGAVIDGTVSCDGTILSAMGQALSLDHAKIRGHVRLCGGFESAGEISMAGANVSGQVICDDASIRLFYGVGMSVGGDFVWTSMRNAKQATLKLQDASMRSLRDDRASWTEKGNLFVNGLVVMELRLHDPPTEEERAQNKFGKEHPLLAKDRIPWLNLQPDSTLAEPQPWMHLAKLLEDKGHKRSAKRVLFELRKHQSRANWKHRRLRWFGQRWDLAFARLEEQPLRILMPIALCVALGAGLFWPMQAHFAPTSEAAYTIASRPAGPSKDLPLAYPKFQPIVYALENVLPIVKLGQDDHWAPDARHSSFTLYWALMLMRWFLILAGWAQGVVLAAAVSARFRA